jgi:hypothetical protein
MKKKLISYITAGSFCLFLAACDGAPAEENTEETADIEVVEEPEIEESVMESMTVMSAEHTVADFDAWMAVYMENSDPEERIGVLINLDDESLIHVAHKSKSHDAARERMGSEEMKKAMEASGVTSEPSIRYMDIKEKNEMPEGTQYVSMMWHEVADYDAWKALFDEDESRRAEAGMMLIGLTTMEDNPNMVFMVFATEDVEKVKGMMADPGLKEKMQNAGVTSEPEASYWRVPEGAM